MRSSGDKFNVSSRSLKDHVTAINIDIPGEDGLYGLKELEITGSYRGSGGGKVIDVHGFKIEPLSTGGLRFWMVNHRPPIDEAGIPLDATKSGANSTIEAFDLVEGSSRLEHVSTFHEDAILTPNGVAPTGDGGFLFTNDHHDSVAPSFVCFQPIQVLLSKLIIIAASVPFPVWPREHRVMYKRQMSNSISKRRFSKWYREEQRWSLLCISCNCR